MIDDQYTPTEYHTALHEAGHAVAFYRLFPDSSAFDVTIIPRDGALGMFKGEDVSFEELETPDDVLKETLQKHAIYCCAGYGVLLAEGFEEAIAMEGCESDFQHAGELLAEGKTGAKDLFADTRNIDAAKFLAQELIVHRAMVGEWAEVAIEVGLGMATDDDYRAYLAMSGHGRN